MTQYITLSIQYIYNKIIKRDVNEFLYVFLSRLLAEQLAKLHSLKPDELLPEEAKTLPRQPRLFKDIFYYLRVLPKDFNSLSWKS